MHVLKAIVAIVIVVLLAILLSGQPLSAESYAPTPDPKTEELVTVGGTQTAITQVNSTSLGPVQLQISGAGVDTQESGSQVNPLFQVSMFDWVLEIEYDGPVFAYNIVDGEVLETWNLFMPNEHCLELVHFRVSYGSDYPFHFCL